MGVNDPLAPIDIPRTKVRLEYQPDEWAPCPYCGKRAEAVEAAATKVQFDIDSPLSGSLGPGLPVPFTMAPETITYQPCGHTLDTLSGEWS